MRRAQRAEQDGGPSGTPGDAAALRAHARASLRAHHLALSSGPLRVRIERRAGAVYVGLVLVAVAIAAYAMVLGDYGISIDQVVAALRGRAEDRLTQYFVSEVRLPRTVTGALVGAALGTSGAIFQTISGNPLGSPDVIGLTTGAATGALLQIIVLGGDTRAVALAAVVGGLLTAVLVYGLTWRGGISGLRLVLVGVGVGAFLAAVNALLVVKAPLEEAQTASQWLAGSLNGTLWPEATAVAVALAVLLPVAWSQLRALGQLPLGDVTAIALGVRVERTRFVLILVGVALMAVATAATGPIAFVALAAPHLVRRLTGTAGVALVGSGLMGAVLVLASDIVARRLFAPNELAVGVVTGSLGGLYLVFLLAVERRRL
ncbi:MAG: FecCD family ABC transporter permease [Acidimicrobiia bacterium]